jgi:hypothetical protein
LISWFPKIFFYWFSERIKTFYRRKTGFYEKKKSVTLPSAVNSWLSKWEFCPADFWKILSSWTLLLLDHWRNWSNWSFFCIFDIGNKFRRVAATRIFGSFFTFIWKIYQFLCFWAWFDVNYCAELKKVYFMGSEMQPQIIRAHKSISKIKIW